MPGRKHKKYRKPRRPFEKARIQEEDTLVRKYGLKNKKEVWKADSAIENIRKQAKLLLTKTQEEQDKFIDRLSKQGFVVASIADVLALDKEDHLKRRLQSVVVAKKLCTTLKQARQFIVHKHITIDKKIVNKPSYIVKTDEENKIELNVVQKVKKKTKIEEIKEEMEGKASPETAVSKDVKNAEGESENA